MRRRLSLWLTVRATCTRTLLATAAVGLLVTVFEGTSRPFRGLHPPPDQFGEYQVESVLDGNTVRLTNGFRVRLAQIDAPKLSENECYAQAARDLLESLIPARSRISLVRDPALKDTDRYGRIIRYVVTERGIVNLELVRRGGAGVLHMHGKRGRYANELMRSVQYARRSRFGLWRRCGGTRRDATRRQWQR